MPERAARPRLAPGVRLHFDNGRQGWVLLAPERVIETEGPVEEIVRRCDGEHTVTQIIDELAALFTAPHQEIATDVTALLDQMAASRLIVL